MKPGLRIGIAVFILAGLNCTGLHSQTFVLNGSASSLGGDCYQLTPDVGSQAGSFFSQNTIDLSQPFSINATLFFGCKDGNGADGIDFIFATSNTALGNGGGGIGYEGITPSIAIEYDDYFNSNFNDPTSDHMAIISNGVLDHTLPTNLAGPVDLSNIEDCMDHCFYFTWDPVTFTLTATLDENTISYTGDIVTNIFSGNSLVYYGFSSGTGSLSNLHRVCFGPPELEPMADVSVCEGESIDLEADPNGIAWTWEPHPTLSPLDVNNPTASPTTTTEYTTIIEYSCGYLGYDTVVVTVIPEPVIMASNNSILCEGETLLLMATGGVSYEWDGPMGFSSTSQNPVINNVSSGMAGLYTVTVTDANGCSAVTETEVEIDLGPTITIDPLPDPICENLDPFQLTASPSGGIWDGEITPSGLFDPGYAEAGTHLITYTVSNALGCFNTEEIMVVVLSAPDVLINPPGMLCVTGNPVQLTGSPTGGIWEGEITIGGVFDPVEAGLGTHIITYTAEDSDGCSNSEQISIQVVQEQAAEISPQGPFCGTDTITLTAIPPGGTWGGATNPNGQILPFALSEGSHLVTYQLNGINECYESEISIEIHYPTVLSCDNGPKLCFNDPPVMLTATPPGGIWSGVSNAEGLVDPSSLPIGLHMAVYSDTSNVCNAGVSCWTYVEIFDAPSISNVSFNCDSLSTFYTVSFSILGGDTSSYIVTGTANGTLIPGLLYHFVSGPIVAGSAYSFIADDANHCYPDTVTGVSLCNCATNAGMMDVNPIIACEDDTISVLPPSGVVLDPNDSLIYILHSGNPANFLLASNSNRFVFAPPLQTGVTYFISTVAGNASPGTGVDPSDPCLSISLGTPVMWVQNPSGFLTGPTRICNGESATLMFNLSGGGPFNINYADGSGTHSLDSILSGYVISVLPATTTFFNLVNVSDLSPPGCVNAVDTGIWIEVDSNFLVQQTSKICSGDSVFLSGSFQSDAGIYFDTLATQYGCDSIIETSLTVIAVDTTFLNNTICDSSQTGVFVVINQDQYGCDSTTITSTTYAEADTTLIQSITCDQQEAGIFTDILISQDGCDSLVIETIHYIPPDSTFLSGNTCDDAAAGTFIEVYFNTAGCDSLVIETITLLPSDTVELVTYSCLPGDTGVHTVLLQNIFGCDSLVKESIGLLPSDSVVVHQNSCLPTDTGWVLQYYTNIWGCDSVVAVMTSLAPEEDCITIVREVFVPNIFSPNLDGNNDFFFISANPDHVSKIQFLKIYDRWGELILERIEFQPNDYTQGWDGTLRGKILDPGVFAWTALIEFADGKMEIVYGDVTLIR